MERQRITLAVIIAVGLFQFLHMFLWVSASAPSVDRFLGETAEHQGEIYEEKPGWKDIHVFYGDTKHLAGKHLKSQCCQDKLVAGLLKQKKAGYFVDLAANDAVSLSNTYKLETDLNWNGLCIEPNPRYWRQLSYRKCEIVAAVVGKNRMEEVKFKMHDGTRRAPGGGIESAEFDNTPNNPKTKDPPVSLYTVPLLEVLEKLHAPTQMDYMSLDVEGAEYFIMKDFPFDRYSFKVMTVERPNQELVDLLYSHNYKYIAAFNNLGDETLWVQ